MSLRSLTASRRTYWVAGAVGALLAVALIMLATFPWGVLRETVERQASKQVGRPVTISRIERLDSFSFAPTIAIHDVVIPQAAWAGPGTLAHIVTARVRFSAWAVLIGRFEPLSVEIDGLRLALARDARHRVNWRKDGATPGGDDAAPKITHLILRDARVTYRDAFRQRSFDLTLSSDAQGFRVGGVGVVRGQSVRVTAHGPAVTQDGKPWPFQARIDGPALTMSARGAMDAPLDTHHMTIDVTARATNLNLVDAIIEAGLIETQPVTLAAHARRDGRDWNVSSVTGRIGQSDIAGHVTVHKADGRARLDGAIVADRLRFNDFSSNEGLAKAAALTRAEGEKLVPNLRINIAKIATTDGTIAFTVRHLVDNGGAGAFTGLSGRVTMDHQLMTVDPLRFTMQRGTMSGTLRVDQRGGRPVPIVTVDLAIRESSLGVIAGTAGGLFTGGDEEAGLRCVALRLDLRHGIGRADPFVIDTTRSQSNGSGTITFPAETLALDMTGRPKDRIVLRLPGSLHIGGTIKQPEPVIPPGVKSVGNIFKAIGRAIRGDQGPLARDADCAGLARRVLQ
jgi:hypothetical protein